MKLTFDIASVPDRKNLVAEIWYGKNMIAEINKDEKGRSTIELYDNTDGLTRQFYLKEFLDVLVAAEEQLG